MLKPTQDQTLKKYLVRQLNNALKNKYGELDDDIIHLTNNILRHLNALGYIQMPKPAIPDKFQEPTANSDLTTFWNELEKK